MSFLENTWLTNILTQHPCFNDEAHDRVGRIHLPIADSCNIQCNYCERNTCARNEMQHPGWTAKSLSVSEAINLVRSIMHSRGENYSVVVGVAGPGDPLANNQTFEALSMIHKEYPHLLVCLCTNGLLLEDKLADVIDAGIKALTVTINAANNKIGEKIYSWAKYKGTTYFGEEAANLLIEKQFSGIKMAAEAGLLIKVNSVFIPNVNDKHMHELASKIRQAGAEIMNILPLIPSGKMNNYSKPSCDQLKETIKECEQIIPQFRRCQQCRADVIYLP